MTSVAPPAKARWWAAVRALREWHAAEFEHLCEELDFYGTDRPEGDPTDPDADPALHRWAAWLPDFCLRLELLNEAYQRREAALDERYNAA
jgi:hypothetical protein